MRYDTALLAVLLAALLVSGVNVYRARALMDGMTGMAPANTMSLPGIDVRPTGMPEYGAELGVSYDDVTLEDQARSERAIARLAALEELTLTPEQKARYIAIASQISCEYCCGAAAIISKSGEPACGCTHSGAMRGLAKHLIQKGTYSNDEILEELGKWKVLFFPEQHSQKAAVLQSQGIPLTYINLASNAYRGIGSGGAGMAGGC